jgi:tRNA pseudouridine38-40 synthase
MEQRIKLTIAYLGTKFHGWQRQPSQCTVQGELERALAAMTGGIAVAFVGAGRTDAGVHAAGQVAHVDLPLAIPPSGLQKGLNQHLSHDIRVRAVRRVSPVFHARKNARGKLYTYRLRWREATFPWFGLRTATLDPITSVDDLEAAIRLLPGHHDMASFTVPDATDGPTSRTLFDVRCRRRQSGLDLDFLGDGFLRYQVRRMVGALLEVARHRLTVAEFGQLLHRPRAGASLPTAPARGLTLEHVYYRDAVKLRPPGGYRRTRSVRGAKASTPTRGSNTSSSGPVVDSEPPG